MTEQLREDVKGLLSHARHELRTPINAIIGYSEMLLEDAADLPNVDFLVRLGQIQKQGKQLQVLITELMGENTTTGIKREDLPVLLESVRQKMLPICNHTLDDCTVLLQETEQKAYQPFRDDLNRISIAATRFLDLLMDPFDRAAREPEPESCEQPENLPKMGVAHPETSERGANRESPSQVAQFQQVPPITGRGHVLIVDDNEFNRDMLARLLQREKYSFDQAHHGKQALEMLSAKGYDLVLLDILMPEMDGFETLKRIKANPDWQHVPVIMISALDEISGVVRCIEMGAEDYLPKPFDPVLLRARLGACLEQKRLRDQELDYLRNVARVTEAAATMEAGKFQPETLETVSARTDALGQLARVFLSMAREVQAREQRLQMQVQQLRVEIDQTRKAKQVAEITETDFFDALQKKAQDLKNRTRK